MVMDRSYGLSVQMLYSGTTRLRIVRFQLADARALDNLTSHDQTRWTTAACSMAPNAQIGESVSEKPETSSRSS